MVENGVRKEIRSLNEAISAAKARFGALEEWKGICESRVAYYISTLARHKKELGRTKGTDEESEAREGVKNIEGWLEKYAELFEMHTREVDEERERLEALELRLKELKK